MANVKFLQGTKERFQSITPDNNTFYLVDGQDLYLGSQKLNNQTEIDAAVVRIAKNEGDILTLRADLDAFAGESGSSSISSMLSNLEASLKKYTDDKAAELVDNEAGRAQQAEGVLGTAISNLEKKVNDNETDIETKYSSLNGVVEGHTETIGEHTTAISDLDTKIDNKISEVNTSIQGVGTRIDNLLGDDGKDGAAPTIRTIAEDAASKKVDEIVDNAPENFNTLKEIANWITNDGTEAASVAATVAEHGQAIQALETADEGFETRIKANEDKVATVDDRIATAANKAKSDAEAHADELNTAMNQTVSGINTRLATAEGLVANHGERLEAVEGTVEGHTTIIGEHTSEISTAKQAIKVLDDLTKTYKDIVNHEWSEVTSAVSTAEASAKAYIDTCLTWGPIA